MGKLTQEEVAKLTNEELKKIHKEVEKNLKLTGNEMKKRFQR